MELLKSLDWDIEIKPIKCDNVDVPGYQALKRSDNGVILHVSKDSYHPTTNARLNEIIKSLQKLTGFELEGFAEFTDGKKVLGYLRSSTVEIAGNTLDNFLVVGNSHDGTQTTYIGLATVFGPEKNAFSKILKHKIPHTVNANAYLDQFTDKIEDFKQLELGLHQKLKQWHTIALSDEKIEFLTKKVLEINPKSRIENVSTRRRNIYLHIQECVNKQTASLGQNLLAWFYGVMYYTTHDRSSKEKVFGNIIGSSSYFNEVSFNIANKFASDLI